MRVVIERKFAVTKAKMSDDPSNAEAKRRNN